MKRTMEFLWYRSDKGKRDYRFTLVAANGEPICSGEGYRRKIDMMLAINLAQSSADATIRERGVDLRASGKGRR